MPGLSFSMIITSDKGVVVDRTMRFGVNHRGATTGRGVTIVSTIWQFAQGLAAGDRQTFLTILNPNQSTAATVTATFFDTKGKPVGYKTIVVDALRRGNIKLNDVLPKASVAMLVSSSVPVVVERPLYIGPANLDKATAGAGVFGRNGGGLSWQFAGGSLANGAKDDYYFYNPGLKENAITATFYNASGKTTQEKVMVPPNSTLHLSVAGIDAIAGQSYGVTFKSTNGQLFVVEQQSQNSSSGQFDGTQGIAG
jgi:hypothetical protein